MLKDRYRWKGSPAALTKRLKQPQREGGARVVPTKIAGSTSESGWRTKIPKRRTNKVKERFVGLIDLTVRLGRKTSRGLTKLEGLDGSPSPRRLVRKSLRHKGRMIRVVFRTKVYRTTSRYEIVETGKNNQPCGDMLLQALVWVFDGVNRSRKNQN